MLIFAAVAAMGYLNVQTVSRQEMLASVIGNEAVAMGHMNCHIYDMRRNGAGWQVYVYAKSVEVNEVSYSGNTRVLIYTDNVDWLRIGQSLTVAGEFYRPDIADNPGQFDARTYYAHKGIYVMCRALNIDSSGSYSYVGDMLFRLRQLASGTLADYFDEGDASVIRAMLLGEKSGLDSDTKRLFQMNGIAHILAISGVKTLKLDIPLVPETRINWAFMPLHIAIIYILKLCLDEEIIPRCRFPCSRGYLTKCINWQKKQ